MESPRRVLTRRGLSIWRQRQGKHVRRAEDAKNCRPSGRQFENIERKSALAELGSPTGGFEAVLLTLYGVNPLIPNGFPFFVQKCTSNCTLLWTRNKCGSDLGNQIFGLIVGQVRIDVKSNFCVLMAGQDLDGFHINAG